MDAVVSTDEGVVIIAVLLVVLYTAYTAYEAALPRPLPNIPYNSDAAHRLLGDVPEWMGYVMRTKLIFVSQHSPQAAISWLTRGATVLVYTTGRATSKPHRPGVHQALVPTVGGSDRPF